MHDVLEGCAQFEVKELRFLFSLIIFMHVNTKLCVSKLIIIKLLVVMNYMIIHPFICTILMDINSSYLNITWLYEVLGIQPTH